MIDVRIQSADFDPGHQIRRLEALAAGSVASVTVAAIADAEATEIHIDHYPALARNALARIAAEAEQKFGLSGIILIHRHGALAQGDRLAFVAVAAPAADVTLEACARLVEALGKAPFWRRETLVDGRQRWR